MMKRLSLLLALLLTLANSAGALKMSIWDREMQTTLGVGESSGSKFNVQLVKNYSGPVVVIFSQSDEEKRSGNFTGLDNRYDGVLKGGVLTLMASEGKDSSGNSKEPGSKENNGKEGNSPAAISTSATAAGNVKAGGLTLTKLLQPYKLNVVVQTTQTGLPGDHSPLTDHDPPEADPPSPAPQNTSNGTNNKRSNGNLQPFDLNHR